MHCYTEKPGLDAFYDIRPGNGAGLFSKEKTSKEGKKYKKVKKIGRCMLQRHLVEHRSPIC